MREWTLTTENNDKIELVLRLMSLSGIQQRIVLLQEPIVSISSYQNQLWIIHHSTQVLRKEQALSYVLLDIGYDHYSIGPLTSTPKTKLSCVFYIFR
ncbi:hypothetical protein I4U23_026968 [Adineta vaga]|nr:hypothetical protein I4U23_026968 [Adineta vaga]